MSSILTNNSAMNALSTLRGINSSLNQTQDRISTGLKVSSAKDNAAYFAISESMKGDSSMLKSINESLTQTKNSVATAAFGATEFKDLASDFTTRLSFAQNADAEGLAKIEEDLKAFVAQMETVIEQSTFNGDDLVNAAGDPLTVGTGADDVISQVTIDANGDLEYWNSAATPVVTTAALTDASGTRDVVTGISRKGGNFDTTKINVSTFDLTRIKDEFKAIAEGYIDPSDSTNNKSFVELASDATTGAGYLTEVFKLAEGNQGKAIDAATSLGSTEKSLENQQEFLTKLADNIDAGVGAMVDANMEEEAARLQALQVQQQLASQSLSIANQAPQNILSLFR